ncbi:MAG: hypothetical protein ACJAYM_001851 [Flavobacteriales bacterium]|jgi:hypothetical protein
MNFYVLDENSVQLGPFSALELQKKGLQPNAQIRTDRMSEWVNADSIDALKFIFDPSIPFTPEEITSAQEKGSDSTSTENEESSEEAKDENSNQASSSADSGKNSSEEPTAEILPVPVPQENKEGQGQHQGEGEGQGQGQGQKQQQQQRTRSKSAFTSLPVYDELFDINRLTDDEKKRFSKTRFTDEMSVGVCILLHFITCGIFTIIYCGLKYDNLPKVKSDDFGAGQAIGFLFIPFFNIYWQFIFWRTLAARINFQFRLRGQEGPISMELATAFCIMTLIPFVNLLNFFIIAPILLSQVQTASIELARFNRQEREN